MTIAEAIKILECAIKKPNTKDGYLGQALSMAINSLKVDEMYQLEMEDADEFISKLVLKDIEYEMYKELCREVHKKDDCPCTNQTTSCLAKLRVCDASSVIFRVINKYMEDKE